MWLKVCGVQVSRTGIYLASRDEVDAVGINRYPESSRYLTAEEARALSYDIKKKDPSTLRVGVYVDEPTDEIRSDISDFELDAVQLHGDESPAIVHELSDVTNVIKAFRVSRDFSTDVFDKYNPWAFLLDAHIAGEYGGTGETAPWQRIRPWTETNRIILAGGLTPNNVETAYRTAKPWGLDVNSGVEDDSGKKDREKLNDLLSAVNRIPS